MAWDTKGKGRTCLQITDNLTTKAWLRQWGRARGEL